MTSPKGESNVSQAFVYKGSESKCVDSAVAEDMLADGWFDNPTDAMEAAKTVDKKTAKKK